MRAVYFSALLVFFENATKKKMQKEKRKCKKKSQNSALCIYLVLFKLFSFRVIADAQNIINGHLMKCRKLYENACGDISLPQLIITINLLRAVECLCHILLRQIFVFSQISYSFIHHMPSPHFFLKKLYQTSICSIDFYCKMQYNNCSGLLALYISRFFIKIFSHANFHVRIDTAGKIC